MKTCGLTETRLRAAAGVDRKTLLGLLDGDRWPQEETRLKIETALGWGAGGIQDIRDGKEPSLAEDKPRSPLLMLQEDGALAEVPSSTLAEIIKAVGSELTRRITGGAEANPDARPL